MIELDKLSDKERRILLDQARELERKDREERLSARKTYKKLCEEYVLSNIDKLITHQSATEEMVKELFSDFNSLKELKSDVYGSHINAQDSHTSTTEDGRASITIGYNVSIGFDGTEKEGINMIKEFISSLSNDQDNVKKLSAAVNTFLRPNAKTGMLNPSKIIELSKLREQFNDKRFDDGLDIIFQAQQRRQNTMYVSGWKVIKDTQGIDRKVEFRFTI